VADQQPEVVRGGDRETAVPVMNVQPSMGGRVVQGAKWSTLNKLGIQSVQFALSTVLARILTPEDFGLIATISVVTNFATLFFEMGLGAALVHVRNPTEKDLATVFWLNVLSGLFYGALMWAISPWVGSFFHEEALQRYMPLLALNFVLSFGIVHSALLQRKLHFKTVAIVEVSAGIMGAAVSLIVALRFPGPLALALGPAAAALAMSLLYVIAVRWHPKAFISLTSARALWSFSGGLLGFNVVNFWGRNADNLLVGRYLGVDALGLYGRAYNLMLLPVTQITGSLGRVMFPALAAISGDHPRVQAAYLRTLGVVNFVTIPMLLGLCATAEPLIPFLWGGQWIGAVPIFQTLCLAGIPQCLATSVGWIFQSQGRTGTMFLSGVASSAVGVGGMIFGLQWGVMGVAIAVAVTSWLSAPVVLYFAGRTISLRLGTILMGAFSTLACSIIMATLVWGLPKSLGLDSDAAWVLAVQVPVGIGIYLVLSRLFNSSRLKDVVHLITRRTAST
jgi:O-antigen/teichoic acid export membrane protein